AFALKTEVIHNGGFLGVEGALAIVVHGGQAAVLHGEIVRVALAVKLFFDGSHRGHFFFVLHGDRCFRWVFGNGPKAGRPGYTEPGRSSFSESK
nr:hypothetical protein [Tanacetum cinerariifolium]